MRSSTNERVAKRSEKASLLRSGGTSPCEIIGIQEKKGSLLSALYLRGREAAKSVGSARNSCGAKGGKEWDGGSGHRKKVGGSQRSIKRGERGREGKSCQVLSSFGLERGNSSGRLCCALSMERG